MWFFIVGGLVVLRPLPVVCKLRIRGPALCAGWQAGPSLGRGRRGPAFSSPALQLPGPRLAGSPAVPGCVQVAHRPGWSPSWPPLGLSALIPKRACHPVWGALNGWSSRPEGAAAPRSRGGIPRVGAGPSPWDPGKTVHDRGRRPRFNWEAFPFPPRPTRGGAPGTWPSERAGLSLGEGQRAGCGEILVW